MDEFRASVAAEVADLTNGTPSGDSATTTISNGTQLKVSGTLLNNPTGTLDIRGAEAVRHLYEATTRLYPDTGTPKTKHVITNPIVEIDEARGSAECRSQYTVFQQTDTLPLQPIITGRYHHRFERVEGVWKITAHRFFVDLVGDISQHLLVPIGD